MKNEILELELERIALCYFLLPLAGGLSTRKREKLQIISASVVNKILRYHFDLIKKAYMYHGFICKN